MATIDATKGQVQYSGDAFFLPAILKDLKDEYVHLLDEIKQFKLGESDSDEKTEGTLAKKFGFRIYKQHALIVLIASATVEGIANFILAKHTDENTFAIIERASPIDKWVTLPKLFIPEYQLKKDEAIYYHLSQLIKRRNAFTHPKTRVKIDKKIIHQGKLIERGNNEAKLHSHFCDLPKNLIENYEKYDRLRGAEARIFLRMFVN